MNTVSSRFLSGVSLPLSMANRHCPLADPDVRSYRIRLPDSTCHTTETQMAKHITLTLAVCPKRICVHTGLLLSDAIQSIKHRIPFTE